MPQQKRSALHFKSDDDGKTDSAKLKINPRKLAEKTVELGSNTTTGAGLQ